MPPEDKIIELLRVVMLPAISVKDQLTDLLLSPVVKVSVTVEATATHSFGVTNALVVISPPIFMLTAPDTFIAAKILIVAQ